MSIHRLEKRLAKLEARLDSSTTCRCRCPRGHHDPTRLSPAERFRLAEYLDAITPETSDPCPVCGCDRSPQNFSLLTVDDRQDAQDLLNRAAVDSRYHVDLKGHERQ